MTANRRQLLDFSASDGRSEPLSTPTTDSDLAEPAVVAGPDPELHGAARYAYWWALLIPLFWGVSLLAFGFGYGRSDGLLEAPAVRAAVLLALTLTPVGVALFAAYVVRQGARLATEARLTRIVAEEMSTPALIASALSGRAMTDVTRQIEAARAAAVATRDEALRLRQALAEESRTLLEAAAEAERTGDRLRRQLGGERVALEALTVSMGQQAGAIEETIKRGVSLLTDASDLAQAQLGEAEAALAARAAGLDAAGAAALETGRSVSEDLARQALRIEDAGAAVGEQLRAVEDGLILQRAALAEAAEALGREHAARSEEAETQRSRLEDALIAARFGASEIREQSAEATERVRDLLTAAGDQLEALAIEARDRRNELESETHAALARVAAGLTEHRQGVERDLTGLGEAMTSVVEVAADSAGLFADAARRKLEDLRAAAASGDQLAGEALEHRMAAARAALDQMAEASFSAASQADAQFESRLKTARRLVDRSSQLIDEVGERTAIRLQAGVDAADRAFDEVRRKLEAFDGPLGRLPSEAREASALLTRDLDALLAAARRAAEETRAIDEAFQDRIRRNYDVLSQAVRVMGEVTARGAPAPDGDAGPPEPAPLDRTPPVESAEAPAVRPRPRLRLTPDASTPAAAEAVELEALADEEFQDLFVQAGGPPGASAPAAAPASGEGDGGDDGWTWRALLDAAEPARRAGGGRATGA